MYSVGGFNPVSSTSGRIQNMQQYLSPTSVIERIQQVLESSAAQQDPAMCFKQVLTNFNMNYEQFVLQLLGGRYGQFNTPHRTTLVHKANSSAPLHKTLCDFLDPCNRFIPLLCHLSQPQDKARIGSPPSTESRLCVSIENFPYNTFQAFKEKDPNKIPKVYHHLCAAVEVSDSLSKGALEVTPMGYFLLHLFSHLRDASLQKKDDTWEGKTKKQQDKLVLLAVSVRSWATQLFRYYTQSKADSEQEQRAERNNKLKRAMVERALLVPQPNLSKTYLHILKAFCDYFLRDYPSEPQPSSGFTSSTAFWTSTQTSGGAPLIDYTSTLAQHRPYFASLFVQLLLDYALDTGPSTSHFAFRPTSTACNNFKQMSYINLTVVNELVLLEKAKMESRFQRPSHKSTITSYDHQLTQNAHRFPWFITQKEISKQFYIGLLQLLNTCFDRYQDVTVPLSKVVSGWLTYCQPFPLDIKSDLSLPTAYWIWTLFVVEHYEMYSLIFIAFLKYCKNTGYLHQMADGISLFRRVLELYSYSPLKKVLQQISKELVQHYAILENKRKSHQYDGGKYGQQNMYGGMFQNNRMGTLYLEQLIEHQYINTNTRNHSGGATSGSGLTSSSGSASSQQPPNNASNVRHCAQVPIFTKETTETCKEILQNAFDKLPTDATLEVEELATMLSGFFGEEFTLQHHNSTYNSSSREQLDIEPHREITKAHYEPMYRLTDVGRAELCASGFRSPPDTQIGFWGDPDSKPIMDTEIACLVVPLLKLQHYLRLHYSWPQHCRLRYLAYRPCAIIILCLLIWILRRAVAILTAMFWS